MKDNDRWAWLLQRIVNYLALVLLTIGTWYFARNEQRVTALELGQLQTVCEHALLSHALLSKRQPRPDGTVDLTPCDIGAHRR